MKTLILGLACVIGSPVLFAQMTGSINSANMLIEPKAALPVFETFVPASVISAIKQKSTNTDQVYDITAVRTQNNQAANSMETYNYVVRIIRNGVIVTEKLDENGNNINM